jgi:pyridoxamine 5'-phosphate oxidase
MNLPELDTDAWIDLELAGTDPNSGFRYVNLCTVDSEGHPQARLIVVLRTRKRARSRSTRISEPRNGARSTPTRR